MLGNALKNTALVITFLSLGAVFATASPAPAAVAGKPALAAFELFKGLAGDWVAAEDGEMSKKGDLVARYVRLRRRHQVAPRAQTTLTAFA